MTLCHGCEHARMRLCKIPPEMANGQILPPFVQVWCNAGESTIIMQTPILSCEDFIPSELKGEDRVKMIREVKQSELTKVQA
jgi:hypothetical protein